MTKDQSSQADLSGHSQNQHSECCLEYVDINSVPIQIAQLGFRTSIFKSFSSIKKSSICIVFIPGEAGDIEYYLPFLKNLYRMINLPTIGIGHAGHSNPKNNAIYDCYSKTCKLHVISSDKKNFKMNNSSSILFNQNLFNIHGQVQSKLVFLRKFLPAEVKVLFVSHGIGRYDEEFRSDLRNLKKPLSISYIALQILNSYPLKMIKLIMIAPSIENIYHTKLDRLVFYLFKQMFTAFFKQYKFIDGRLIPFLMVLFDDSFSLIKDLNGSLMKHLAPRIKMIYFAEDDLNFKFCSKSNRRMFSIDTFVVSDCEHLVKQTISLVKKSHLNKKQKQNQIKELEEELIKLKQKNSNLVHDFQMHSQLSDLVSTHVAIEIQTKLNGQKAPEKDEMPSTSFKSKNDSVVKSISKYLE